MSANTEPDELEELKELKEEYITVSLNTKFLIPRSIGTDEWAIANYMNNQLDTNPEFFGIFDDEDINIIEKVSN